MEEDLYEFKKLNKEHMDNILKFLPYITPFFTNNLSLETPIVDRMLDYDIVFKDNCYIFLVKVNDKKIGMLAIEVPNKMVDPDPEFCEAIHKEMGNTHFNIAVNGTKTLIKGFAKLDSEIELYRATLDVEFKTYVKSNEVWRYGMKIYSYNNHLLNPLNERISVHLMGKPILKGIVKS